MALPSANSDSHPHFGRYIKVFNLPTAPPPASRLAVVHHLRGKRLLVAPGAAGAATAWPYALTAEEVKLGKDGMFEKYFAPVDKIGDPTRPGWRLEPWQDLDRLTLAELLRRQGASSEAVALLGATAWFGYGWGEVSALHRLLSDLAIFYLGQRSRVLPGGSDRLPQAFAAALGGRIRYAAAVTRIVHEAGAVRVVFRQQGSEQSLAADRLVCAVPCPALRRIRFGPELPESRRRILERLDYNPVTRVYAQVKRRFWLDGGVAGNAFTDLPIQLVSEHPFARPADQDAGAAARLGILECHVKGSAAVRLAEMDDASRLALAVDHLEQVHPGFRKFYETGASVSWGSDPWAGGGYAWWKPGQLTEWMPELATPVGRVHFAGEHTSLLARTMEGALESGNRAAREVHLAPRPASPLREGDLRRRDSGGGARGGAGPGAGHRHRRRRWPGRQLRPRAAGRRRPGGGGRLQCRRAARAGGGGRGPRAGAVRRQARRHRRDLGRRLRRRRRRAPAWPQRARQQRRHRARRAAALGRAGRDQDPAARPVAQGGRRQPDRPVPDDAGLRPSCRPGGDARSGGGEPVVDRPRRQPRAVELRRLEGRSRRLHAHLGARAGAPRHPRRRRRPRGHRDRFPGGLLGRGPGPPPGARPAGAPWPAARRLAGGAFPPRVRLLHRPHRRGRRRRRHGDDLVEALLARLAAEVLECDAVGREQDLFALGADSLRAAQLLARVEEAFGVELSLDALFQAPPVARPATVTAGRAAAARAPDVPAGAAAEAAAGAAVEAAAGAIAEDEAGGGPAPLSFAQRRLWFLHQLEPGNPVHNLGAAVRCDGPLRAAALAAALSEIVRRHEVLRTGFAARGDEPAQLVFPPAPLPLPLVDLAGLPAPRRRGAAGRAARPLARRPFVLERGQVVRAALLRLAVPEEHELVLAFHHIAVDGGSLAVLAGELAVLYGAFAHRRRSPLAEAPAP